MGYLSIKTIFFFNFLKFCKVRSKGIFWFDSGGLERKRPAGLRFRGPLSMIALRIYDAWSTLLEMCSAGQGKALPGSRSAVYRPGMFMGRCNSCRKIGFTRLGRFIERQGADLAEIVGAFWAGQLHSHPRINVNGGVNCLWAVKQKLLESSEAVDADSGLRVLD